MLSIKEIDMPINQNFTLLITGIIGLGLTTLFLYLQRDTNDVSATLEEVRIKEEKSKIKGLKILFSTQNQNTKKLAVELSKKLTASGASIENVSVACIRDYDYDDFFSEKDICVFLLSTYKEGCSFNFPFLILMHSCLVVGGPCDDAIAFNTWLDEARWDVRVGRSGLSNLDYAGFGAGNSEYAKELYCTFAKNVIMI